jgi:hypothetical protein
MMPTAALCDQRDLPERGRHVLATFGDDTVVVWQAHGHAVADWALEHGRFGGEGWKLDRVTRMRTSLPSLLERCEWGQRPGRERVLAVHLTRAGFDAMLHQAVHAEYEPAVYPTRRSWHLATRYALVSVAWFPDLDARGRGLQRQTMRIGLRGLALRTWSEQWVVGVEDWTDTVRGWRATPSADTPVPVVRTYPVDDATRRRLIGEPPLEEA